MPSCNNTVPCPRVSQRPHTHASATGGHANEIQTGRGLWPAPWAGVTPPAPDMAPQKLDFWPAQAAPPVIGLPTMPDRARGAAGLERMCPSPSRAMYWYPTPPPGAAVQHNQSLPRRTQAHIGVLQQPIKRGGQKKLLGKAALQQGGTTGMGQRNTHTPPSTHPSHTEGHMTRVGRDKRSHGTDIKAWAHIPAG